MRNMIRNYHMSLSFLLYFFFYGVSVECSPFGHDPEVTIAQGRVRGKYTTTFNKRLIATFEGIPYAKAPVGQLRFKNPLPSDPWTGTLDATKPPPICIQTSSLGFGHGKIDGTEDCLFINVYTPKVPSKDKPKLYNVLAFIHGGGFIVGKSWDHQPTFLLDNDVVLVTFNYRLGALGFLSTEDIAAPGNFGLKDQTLALKWIKQNIAAFGGDPDSVTVGGISAGGASCSFHMLSPLSKGLFNRAICISGVATNPWSVAEGSKEKAKVLGGIFDCPTHDSFLLVECLRKKPADKIVTKLNSFMYDDMLPFAPFAPIVEPQTDGAFISDLPLNILMQGKGSDVPVLFSYVLDEGALLFTNPKLLEDLKNQWDDVIPHALDYNFSLPLQSKTEISKKIKQHYKIDKEPDNIANYIKLVGDRTFVAGISKIAKVSAAHYTSPVYLYRFSYKGKKSFLNVFEQMGAKNSLLSNYPNPTHSDDVMYTLGFSTITALEGNESDKQLAQQMHELWISFLDNGNPGENWKPVKEKLPKIVFTDIKGPKNFKLTVEDELGEESFWYSLGFKEN